MNVYTAWDFAIGEKQANDWTVGATILQDERDNLYVIDLVRFKGDSFTIVESILDVAERWGTEPRAPYLIGFEDGQIWRAIEPLLKKRMQERLLFPSYEILRPLTDKMARARSLQGRMQQGRVFFPENAPWRADAEHELLRFPGGVHDDIVDALAWATNLVVGKAAPRPVEPQQPASWKDKLNDTLVLEGTHMSA
jgi:predicted phage terminase large subunit-like protein